MILSVQLIKLLKSSIIWTVHQIGINNGIYGFWIISPYLMIKRLHSRLRTVALVTWNKSCWWGRGGGVFSSDRRTMVAAEARAEVQGRLWCRRPLLQNLSSWILFPFVKNYCEKGSKISAIITFLMKRKDAFYKNGFISPWCTTGLYIYIMIQFIIFYSDLLTNNPATREQARRN